jgi:hypothetical protein
MTETLAAFLAVVSLWCLTRYSQGPSPFRAGTAGLALALAALCRPTFWVWAAAVAIPLVWTERQWWRRAASLAAFAMVFTLTQVPWVLRNWWAVEHPVLTTTHGGYTLLLGNNPHFYEYVREGEWGTTWDAREFDETLKESFLWYELDVCKGVVNSPFDDHEVRFDHFAYQQAWQNIRAEPVMFVWSSVVRVWRLWGILPYQTDPNESVADRLMRYAVAVWYAVIFVLAGVGAVTLGRRIWRTPWLWGILLCLSFTAVHTFYWSNLRMRAPLMPFVALLAAAGMQRLMQRRLACDIRTACL